MAGQRSFAGLLGIALLVIWAVLAIHPVSRSDWLLENTLVFISVPLIAWFGPRLPLSNAAYACLFVFFVLHLIGAHYTYSEVPFLHDAAGRNNYDRVVHFLYGLLMARPTMDLLAARAPSRGIWLWLLPVLFLTSHGAIYEILEWVAAERFGGGLGEAFLGTQGDSWDAQEDMAMASVGAMLGVSAWLLMRRAANRV
jgi:putative membrane protein